MRPVGPKQNRSPRMPLRPSTKQNKTKRIINARIARNIINDLIYQNLTQSESLNKTHMLIKYSYGMMASCRCVFFCYEWIDATPVTSGQSVLCKQRTTPPVDFYANCKTSFRVFSSQALGLNPKRSINHVQFTFSLQNPSLHRQIIICFDRAVSIVYSVSTISVCAQLLLSVFLARGVQITHRKMGRKKFLEGPQWGK